MEYPENITNEYEAQGYERIDNLAVFATPEKATEKRKELLKNVQPSQHSEYEIILLEIE
jgi:hypothetical protein